MTRLSVIVRIAFIALIITSVSCGPDEAEKQEDPFVQYDPIIINVVEEFDAAGSLRVRALHTFKLQDTIESIGFIYTDGIDETDTDNGEREPSLESDHVVIIDTTTLIPDSGPQSGRYVVETLIDPERNYNSTIFEDPVVNIATFIKTTTGNTYISNAAHFKVSKLGISKIYPAYAKAGEPLRIELNRSFADDKVPAISIHRTNDQQKPFTILVDGEEVEHSIAGTGHIIITMPDGITTETEVSIKVEDYVAASADKIKNASRSFTFLTEKERSYTSSPIIFAATDAIYFGGGRSTSGSNAAPDFWKYTISDNTWAKKADYPTDGAAGLGMSLYANNKAWYGQPTHFLRYDLNMDNWTELPEPVEDIQYDHTFSSAQSVSFNGKVYFTHFYREYFLGGTYMHNFWTFDPATEEYDPLDGYPGEVYNLGHQMTQAAVYNGELHFFPGFQHWMYDPVGGEWTKFSDIGPKRTNSSNFFAFSFKNELYGISLIYEVINQRSTTTIRVLKYNSADDTWVRDADVPFTGGINDLFVFKLDEDNAFLAIRSANMHFYRIE